MGTLRVLRDVGRRGSAMAEPVPDFSCSSRCDRARAPNPKARRAPGGRDLRMLPRDHGGREEA